MAPEAARGAGTAAMNAEGVSGPKTAPASLPNPTPFVLTPDPYRHLDHTPIPTLLHSSISGPAPTAEVEMPSELDSFFESLDVFAGPFPQFSQVSPAEYGGEAEETSPRASEGTSIGVGSLDSVVTPGAESTEISPLYAAFNDGFFRSIPKPVRKIMVQRMNNVAASSQLGSAAAMAMVLLYRARTQTDVNPDAQAHLLAQSDHFFQRAVQQLQAPIPLESKLVACLDLQSHQFDLSGGAAANAVLLLSEFFVNESLGLRPALDLSSMTDESNIALRCFAYSDVLRTICIRNRKTVFDFANLPGYLPSHLPSGTPSDALDTHLGLPLGLLLCLAATSNLAVEAPNLPLATVQGNVSAIEQAVRSWRPMAPNVEEDSISYLDRLATAELWRQACLIYLYTTVNRLGCLAMSVRTALQQFLLVAARDGPRNPVSSDDRLWAGSVRACPWFLAATVAILPGDRDQCRRGLRECGPQKGYEINLLGIEKLWETVDRDGWTVDWREVLERENIVVGFL